MRQLDVSSLLGDAPPMNRQQAAALAELQQKTLQQIQVETAYTWAYRAWAAKQLGLNADFLEYQHESLEHSALTGDDGVLNAVRVIMAS